MHGAGDGMAKYSETEADEAQTQPVTPSSEILLGTSWWYFSGLVCV